MKIARILLAIAALAGISQAGWTLGKPANVMSAVGPAANAADKYTIVAVMNETSCAGGNCTGTATGTTAYTVFYVAPAGGAFSGEAIVVSAPTRADSKLFMADLFEAYRNGWKIQVINHWGSGTIETTDWQSVTKLYRVMAGDKMLVATYK